MSFSAKEIKYLTSYPANIPLHDLLLANGFNIIRDKSTRLNPALSDSFGNKFIISKLSNGNYLYFNPNNQSDRGNIYNLCKNHNLYLKSMLESYFNTPITKNYNIEVRKDNESKELVDKFLKLPSYDSTKNHYLQNRMLDSNIINKYSNFIKVDSYHNIYFPQYKLIDLGGNNHSLNIRGYTMKLSNPIYSKDNILLSKPIKSITKGEKGLEILLPNDNKNISKVILSDSSIDNLSFLEISNLNLDNALLIATSGNININKNIEMLKIINDKFKIKEYHLAFDNDNAGKRLRESIKEVLLKEDYLVYKQIPLSKDFNDDLKIFKMLELMFMDYRYYHWNTINKEYLKENISKKCEDLFEDFEYAKKGKERANILKKIRQIDSIYKIPNHLKERFNNYEYKDKKVVKKYKIYLPI